MASYIISVDIGGTQIRAALSDREGNIIHRVAHPTLAEEGPEPVIGRIKEAIREAVGQHLGEVQAIGIATAGPLDPWEGVIIKAPNLPGWRNVPLKAIIEKEFGLLTYVGNDANLAALAEQRFGAGKGTRDLIYITHSTGIGGGIIVDGRMLLGSKGLGAEVGHITLDIDGPRCGCGSIGCLEAMAAGPAIARNAVQAIEAGRETIIPDLVDGDLSRISAREVNEAAQQGDALGIELIRQAGELLGIGLVSLIHLFNPEIIVIGGGVSKAGDLLFEPVRQTVRARCMAEDYWRDTPIVPAALGEDVGLMGAIALVLSQEESADSG
jgi:glucokinase